MVLRVTRVGGRGGKEVVHYLVEHAVDASDEFLLQQRELPEVAVTQLFLHHLHRGDVRRRYQVLLLKPAAELDNATALKSKAANLQTGVSNIKLSREIYEKIYEEIWIS